MEFYFGRERFQTIPHNIIYYFGREWFQTIPQKTNVSDNEERFQTVPYNNICGIYWNGLKPFPKG